jgi:hypothetical protein
MQQRLARAQRIDIRAIPLVVGTDVKIMDNYLAVIDARVVPRYDANTGGGAQTARGGTR